MKALRLVYRSKTYIGFVLFCSVANLYDLFDKVWFLLNYDHSEHDWIYHLPMIVGMVFSVTSGVLTLLGLCLIMVEALVLFDLSAQRELKSRMGWVHIAAMCGPILNLVGYAYIILFTRL
jgi:hypothetical protein